MEYMDRLITALLDGKFASYDAKMELAESLGIQTDDVLGFELISDECNIHQAIAVTLSLCVLEKKCLDRLEFEYLTVNSNGNIVIVIYDEPK